MTGSQPGATFGNRDEIAIIGMTGRFPGAGTIREFWENLQNGVESIHILTPEELRAGGVSDAEINDPEYVPVTAALADGDCFDAAFFGYTKRDAEIMDPQHRIFLECAWAALEDAGYDPETYEGAIGVFGGVAPNTYMPNVLMTRPDIMDLVGGYPILIGSEREYAITRVAYKLNLRGPAVSIATACSTSGVALHLAYQSVLSGETDMALVGGGRVRAPFNVGYRYEPDGILSPDGHCRAFDANAAGTIRGSGMAMIVIKRLSDAIRDGDTVRALVKGTAINNDGSVKIGYTAPGMEGQEAVIAEALEMAEVDPATITYVEAHGTGTFLGDPIEVGALTGAYRRYTGRTQYCAIGSVKSNIGHLDTGAGTVGIIKTVLAMQHGQIPPTVGFSQPNPQIDFQNSPFFVNDTLRDWIVDDGPRRAGVSAFGLGGTNAHIVLEEAPPIVRSASDRRWHLILLSARTPAALEQSTANLASYLENAADEDLGDVAYTLQIGRRPFEHRRVLVAAETADACGALAPVDPRRVATRVVQPGEPSVVFMFPGGGAQYLGMGRQLYQADATFRDAFDLCARRVESRLGTHLGDLLYAGAAGDLSVERPTEALPALFAVEYALARLWMSLGVRPDMMIGHSMGEYTAACLAGVLSLDDALELVIVRGELFERLPSGAMLSVPLPEAEVRTLIGDDLSIAVVNKPDQCIVAGESLVVDHFADMLARRGIDSRRLHIAVAAHSHLIDPILDDFRTVARTIEYHAPEIPFVSNVSGSMATAADVTDPGYWVEHLRRTVRFVDGLATVFGAGGNALIEVGPGQTLSGFTRHHPDRPPGLIVEASLPHVTEAVADDRFFLNSVGRLWAGGVPVELQRLYSGERRFRVPLPTYPFERNRYWIERGTRADSGAETQQLEERALRPESVDKPEVTSAPESPAARKDRIMDTVLQIFSDLSGLDATELDPHSTFLELGFDSLFMTQAAGAVGAKFGVRVSFRQLFEDAPTLDALAQHLDDRLEPDAFPAPTPESPRGSVSPVAGPDRADGSTDDLKWLIEQQLEIMRQQLTVMGSSVGAGVSAQPEGVTPGRLPQPEDPGDDPNRRVPVGPWNPIDRSADELDSTQREYLDTLVKRLTVRTSRSKASTQANRPHLADPRTVSGFRRLWKEAVYPLVVTRSAGSRLWDVDGNEYLDITMGFGVNLFGHSPDFVTEAVRAQLENGVEIGPQTPLAGEVALLISEMTGVERVAFCNTGSEAVLAAMRLARTVTRRSKIVTFSGDYHGLFDEVLARGISVKGERRSVPIAPGIPAHKAQDLIILDYGDPASLEVIASLRTELAGVLVEPVQSRHPDLQPGDFLRDLRRLTTALGVPLIFDEMITGFRSHPGGAQAIFGVQADLVTYGKVIGGGFPIGVVAGSAAYMDALDGGMWQYGDASIPEADVTWFAGTFVRHPIALAAARAALLHLIEKGPDLQKQLNQRTDRFVADLNEYLRGVGSPITIEHFSSLFIPVFHSHQQHASLLYLELRDRGIHMADGRGAFLSTAHTDEDLDRLLEAFKDSVEAMRAGRFLPTEGHGVEANASVERFAEYPLAPSQREIWLAAQLSDETNASFNLSGTVHLAGRLDLGALRKAIQGVMARHDALRTTVYANGDMQRVAPRLTIDVPLEDLSGLEVDVRKAELYRLRAAEVEVPFELDTGPLVRAKVIRLAPDEHLLFLTVHHIICDGWSTGLINGDLAALYTATVRGESIDLEEPMQFGEYVAWQEELRRSESWEADAVFWKKELETPYPISDFPPDRPRPARRTYRADRRTVTMPATLVEALRSIAKKHNGTLFTVLLALLEVYLSRLVGQPDVAFGVSIAGQTQFSGQQIVGHCVNVLPLRRHVEPSGIFGDHLASTRRAFVDAYEHQNYGYGTIVENLVRGRDASRPPLMTVTINMDAPGDNPVFEGLVARTGSNSRHFELFDVFVNLVPHDREMDIECSFNLGLFDPATILRRLEGFMVLAESIANDADSPIAELPILPEAERDLLREWNETGVEYSGPFVLHGLFERWAGERPEDVAVVFRDETLTYGELNGRANRLARLLVDRGVGVGSLVGVLMERSVEMVVCLLAVLKAGAGYVPLDPEYPVDRLEYMVAETGMPLVLTVDGQPVPSLPSGVSVVKVDLEWGLAAGLSDANLEVPVGPEDVAYVIYTSGSTGRPKGVANTHKGISNLLRWMHDLYGMGPDDRLLQLIPFSFDPSVGEVFWPLSFGARLVLAEPGGHRDPAHIVGLIRQHQITKVEFVPSNLGIFLNHPEVGKCTSLRTVLCGGEPLTGDLQDLFFDRLDAELHNVYGPTEAAIDVTYWKCEPDRRYPMIPIGRVLPNNQIHILDDRLAPVPIGVVGELHIGGVQVARGYVNRPDLTAERFIPDPFSPDSNARLYKSGDLARFMADGNIEFLGRRDHQVKIRGFRIELGEIEATLMQHPSIANAAAVISGVDRSNERIFAYVTTRDGSVDEVAVRDFLKRKLPRYMVPARVVVIEKIPVTTSGKIDRNALPLPERSGEHFGFAHVAPRTPLERDIAAVWSEVLGVDDIGVHDDIFDLGGHSLDAMRVNARISEMLQVDLSLLAFFESPTIEGQALAVTRAMASQLLGEEELEAMVADLGAGDARPEGRLTP